MTPPSSIRCLPRPFRTKAGHALHLALLEEHHHQSLIDMYLAYEPRGSIQGLPPLKDSVCVQWVRGVIDNGTNIVAVAAEKSVLGHVALFPVSELVSELLVVVTPSHQNIGIGTELTRSCLEVACELGYERMCLPVDSTNMRARHVYVKCGFAYVSDKLAREIDMTCDLKRVGTVGGRPG